MTTTDIIASSAIGLSAIAMLACVITIPVVFQKGTDIQNELHGEMDEFKTMTDTAWGHLMRKQQPTRKVKREDFGHCHCYDRKFGD